MKTLALHQYLILLVVGCKETVGVCPQECVEDRNLESSPGDLQSALDGVDWDCVEADSGASCESVSRCESEQAGTIIRIHEPDLYGSSARYYSESTGRAVARSARRKSWVTGALPRSTVRNDAGRR